MTRIGLQFVHEFHDRHGKVRRYFRRPGFRQIALTGLPGSSEFMAAYEAALAGMTAPPPMIGASRTKPGTLNAAVVAYYQSLAFRELTPGTQAMRAALSLNASASSMATRQFRGCRRGSSHNRYREWDQAPRVIG